MYKFIHFISAFVRQFLLPNPYINIIGNEGYAELFNIIIGGVILHYLSFILTGCGYTKGIDSSTVGSAGYLFSYCYLTIVITALGYFISNVSIFIINFIIIYIVSCIIVNKIFSKSVF